MASNPMQRKQRNSFLLGMLITLMITGIVIVILLVTWKNTNDKLNYEIQGKQNVYVLAQDVKSGQEITQDMFVEMAVHTSAIPSNATSSLDDISAWYLQTKEGEMVCTDKYGLYLDRSTGNADNIIEVMQNENNELFTYIDGKINALKSDAKIIQDRNGSFMVAEKDQDKITRVYKEKLTDEYYVYKLDDSTMSTGENRTRIKEYIEIKNVPLLAKIDMNANTIITPNLLVQSDEVVTDDVRKQEYNMLDLPVDLMTNDYIDIRLMTPKGQDFIVVSKVKVEVPTNADGTYIVNTIRVNLREDEILAMSSAIVEAYGLLGAKIYATRYVEPAMQATSIPTYCPNKAVLDLIDANPNIVNIAKEEIAARKEGADIRNTHINSIINATEEFGANVQSDMETSITNSSTARKTYLESLQGTPEEE